MTASDPPNRFTDVRRAERLAETSPPRSWYNRNGYRSCRCWAFEWRAGGVRQKKVYATMCNVEQMDTG